MGVRVLGVYPVENAEQPCHLVELEVDIQEAFAVGMVTQEDPDLPRDDWQVAYDERRLNSEGREAHEWSKAFPGRVAFFFHYLRLDRPLLTPAGALPLPKPQERPSRLAFISYTPPC
jgi:hypothetical protein